MVKIFISYRRADSRKDAARIYDRLVEAFGKENIFKDVNDIPIGSDFRGVLREAVAACDVQLVIIGRQWLDVTDEEGNRRLDNPGDFVRIEVESALQRDRCLVVPVLVDHTSMPRADALPPDLRELAFKNATVVRDDPDFHNDVTRIIDALRQRYSENTSVSAPQPTHLPSKPFDIRAAITEFYNVFDQQNWERAQEILTEINISGHAPSFFDVDTHERELWHAIESSERDKDYELMKMMVARGEKSLARKALKQFWKNYPNYDPVGLSTQVIPDMMQIASLFGHKGWIFGVLELKDRRFLSWSREDSTIRLWDHEGRLLQVLEGHNNKVRGVLELQDGNFLSWSEGPTLRLWTSLGHSLALSGHKVMLGGVIELRNNRLLSWSFDKTLRLWNTQGHPLEIFKGHNEAVSGALELNDGCIVSWSRDRTLRLWNKQGKPLHVFSGHTGEIYTVIELYDYRLLSCSWDNTLRIWDRQGHNQTLVGHTGSVFGILQLKDGRLLSWSSDSTLRLWENTGQPSTVLEGHTAPVDGAIILRDGRFISWSRDQTLRLWNEYGKLLFILQGHSNWVSGALELSDGRLLSWSKDNTLRLWGSQGQQLQLLIGHNGSVDGALELSDGRILSWSKDKTIRIWGIPD
jgi:WD40 repeat protein